MGTLGQLVLLAALLGVVPLIGAAVGAATGQSTVVLLSGIAFALGIGLLVVIAVAGLVARTNRVLLVAVFAPLLVVTNVALVPLIALDGAVLTYALAQALPVAALVAGIATVFGVVAMLGRAFSFPFVRAGTAAAHGVALAEEAEPRLWAFVRDVAQRVGTQPPRNVVVGLDLNFFATEQKTVCYSGELSGRTVFVSLPFSRLMSGDELRAVLAHELAHFRGWDTRFSQVFYPVWRGALVSLARLGEEMGESIFSSLPLLPAYGVLSFFIGSFEEAEARLNRSRELAADRVSVEVTDQRTTATALVKTHGFGRYWRRAQALLREQIARAEQDLNICAQFAVAAEENRGSAWMRKDLNEVAPPHPTDTHPPLGTRLERLQLSIADVEEGAFTVRPAEPAAGLLEKGEELERALTELEKRRMIEAHEVREGSKKY